MALGVAASWEDSGGEVDAVGIVAALGVDAAWDARVARVLACAGGAVHSEVCCQGFLEFSFCELASLGGGCVNELGGEAIYGEESLAFLVVRVVGLELGTELR